MKHYFISGTFYIPKNKAHAEFQNTVMAFNKSLFDEKKLNEFKTDLNAKKEEVNKEFKRCKDIDLKISCYDGKNVIFSVEGNFQLSATLVKRYELTEPINIDQ